jgi:hypothetical protein
MLPANSAFTTGTFALPNGQFKHLTSITLLVHEITSTQSHIHATAKRRLLSELYAPLLADLTTGLQTFSHDPTRGLTLLNQLKTQLESEIK